MSAGLADETLSETDAINRDIRQILDVTTLDWGVEVTLVELKDIQLPESMKRAMAEQAEAEREKRAKIINAEGEAQAAAALVEIGVDKNTTVVVPPPRNSIVTVPVQEPTTNGGPMPASA